ncbi:hypothetical protein [Alkalihalobacillus sp. TS-13]|uniref:hypothetical protein n=1 Tax=Alkalihalobacillus sp. TS-13 TaxID=2842455 RepID=UPI001C86E351|nr:hypothetical protein [Alkalihalobacillus sp. TS-13]
MVVDLGDEQTGVVGFRSGLLNVPDLILNVLFGRWLPVPVPVVLKRKSFFLMLCHDSCTALSSGMHGGDEKEKRGYGRGANSVLRFTVRMWLDV